MKISRIVALTASVIAFLALPATAQDDWVEKSNAHAQIVLEAMARFNPESAGSIGVDGLDEEILDLREGLYERDIADSEQVLEELHIRLAEESHPAVRQDLGILIKVIEDSIHTTKLNREYMLPYRNISQAIFGGIRGLIDPQIPAERYPAAIVRLKRYAGLEDGYEPVVELAKDRTRERFAVEGLHGPYRGEVEQDLERSETFISGIEDLLSGTELSGWQEAHATLAGQISDYNQWVRDEILPRSRKDYRMPPPL